MYTDSSTCGDRDTVWKWYGLPYEGGGNVPGSGAGPAYIRDRLHIPVELVALGPMPPGADEAKLRWYDDLTERLTHHLDLDSICPCFIGGDHSLSFATVRAVAHQAPNVAVVWIDAHADYHNRATSVSGNWHGMPLGFLTGRDPAVSMTVPPSRVLHIGARSVDDGEKPIYASCVTMVDANCLRNAPAEALARIREFIDLHDQIHLSCDVDALDPSEAPGVGTPVPGGLTLGELTSFLPLISTKIISADLVEFNPSRDEGDRTLHAIKILLDVIQCAGH